MKNLIVKLSSSGPMLMHSDKLVDPLNPATKEHKKLTSDRQLKKTDEGQIAIARSEFLNSLYLNKKGRVIMPMLNIRKSLIEGARRFKLGKHIEKGVIVLDDAILEYKGPKDPEKLWEDKNFVDARPVRVGQSKIVRYRPVFHNWTLEVEAVFDESVIDLADIKMCWNAAGKLTGLGDFRPLFGRYEVEITD